MCMYGLYWVSLQNVALNTPKSAETPNLPIPRGFLALQPALACLHSHG